MALDVGCLKITNQNVAGLNGESQRVLGDIGKLDLGSCEHHERFARIGSAPRQVERSVCFLP